MEAMAAQMQQLKDEWKQKHDENELKMKELYETNINQKTQITGVLQQLQEAKDEINILIQKVQQKDQQSEKPDKPKVRALDLRDVERPNKYTGDKTIFTDWAEDFESFAGTQNKLIPIVMHYAQKSERVVDYQVLKCMQDEDMELNELKKDELELLDANLYAMIMNQIGGTAKIPIKKVNAKAPGKGGEAWRILFNENQLKNLGGKIKLRKEISTWPKMKNISEVMAQLIKWEERVRHHDMVTNEPLSE